METSKLCWCSNRSCTHCFRLQTRLPVEQNSRILILYLFLICILILTLFHWSRISVTWYNVWNIVLISIILLMMLPLFI